MAAISGVSGVSAAYYQPQQSAPQSKPVKSQPGEDSVQLSKAAQAALSGNGDVDHDGDSH